MTPSQNVSAALQEHDYMKLVDVPSPLLPPKHEFLLHKPSSSSHTVPIHIEETDLRLALGPPERVLSFTTPTSKLGQDVMFSQSKNGLQYHNSTRLHNANSGPFTPTKTISTGGLKRGYSEAMSEFRPTSGNPRLGIFDKSADFPSQVRTAAGPPVGMKNAFQLSGPDGCVSSQHPKFQPPSLHCGWPALKPAGVSSRQLGLENPGGSTAACSSFQIHPPQMGSQETEMTRRASAARSDDNRPEVHDDNPAQKGQVVGWPPIRSFRKTTLAAHPKPTGQAEGGESAVDSSQASLYVKVNMDAVPVGRKVDLRAYNSYEELSYALKEMFQLPNNGQGGQVVLGHDPSDVLKPFHFHNDLSFTYEDKEGDWMLVGDVPWSMFVNTVCRLRIVKSSEGVGIGPRTSERSQCHR